MLPPLRVRNRRRSLVQLTGILLVVWVVFGSSHAQAGVAEPSRSHALPATTPHASYAVVNVAPNDVLNVRARPDAASSVIGGIPSHGVGIRMREAGQKAPKSAWMSIDYRDLTGWVNRRYLARQVGSMDDVLAARAGQIMWALKHKDMQTLSQCVHPDKGVRFSPYAYISDEDRLLHAADISNSMLDQRVYNWGAFDGTGSPIDLTVDAYFMRFIYDADFASPQQVGCNTVIGRGNTINNITAFYPNATFIEYHFEGMDPQQGGMDWRSLRLVLEELKGVWYLVGIVHDEWTI